MTANAVPNIQGGTGGGERGGAVRRADAVRGGREGFDVALLRLAGLDAGAAAAPEAQVPPGGAQPSRGDADRADAPAERQDGSDASEADVSAGVPLTIDELNAMLLVGGGTTLSAGNAARGELRSAAPADAAAPRGGNDGAGEQDAAPRSREAAARAGAEFAAKEEGRGEPRAEPRAEPGRGASPVIGREAGHEQRGEGGSGRNDGRGREGVMRAPAAASPIPGATDPLRALAARGLSARAMSGVKAAGGGGGESGTSTLAVRSFGGGQRGEMAGRTSKSAGNSPAASAARREALVAQMSRILTTAAAKGGGTMTMRLAPESLGAVTVRVGVEEGVVSARFEAATAAARDLLDTTMTALRSSLEAKGLSVERLQVELAPPMDAESAPEDQGAGGGSSEGFSSREGGGGGSADGRAGESGARERVRDEGAEPPVAEVPEDRTDAIGGTGHRGEALRLGLDAVA